MAKFLCACGCGKPVAISGYKRWSCWDSYNGNPGKERACDACDMGITGKHHANCPEPTALRGAAVKAPEPETIHGFKVGDRVRGKTGPWQAVVVTWERFHGQHPSYKDPGDRVPMLMGHIACQAPHGDIELDIADAPAPLPDFVSPLLVEYGVPNLSAMIEHRRDMGGAYRFCKRCGEDVQRGEGRYARTYRHRAGCDLPGVERMSR